MRDTGENKAGERYGVCRGNSSNFKAGDLVRPQRKMRT